MHFFFDAVNKDSSKLIENSRKKINYLCFSSDVIIWIATLEFNRVIFVRKRREVYLFSSVLIFLYVLSFKVSFAYFSLKVTFANRCELIDKHCWNSNQLSFDVQKLMQRWFQFASDNCVCTSARSMRLCLLVVAVCKSRKAYSLRSVFGSTDAECVLSAILTVRCSSAI